MRKIKHRESIEELRCDTVRLKYLSSNWLMKFLKLILQTVFISFYLVLSHSFSLIKLDTRWVGPFMEQPMSSTLTWAEAGGYGRVGGIDFSGRKTATPCWSDRAARTHFWVGCSINFPHHKRGMSVDAQSLSPLYRILIANETVSWWSIGFTCCNVWNWN